MKLHWSRSKRSTAPASTGAEPGRHINVLLARQGVKVRVQHCRRRAADPALRLGRSLDHVGCHTSRSMRPRIRRKRVDVKWLSASCKMRYRAWRISRPPVLNSRCCRLVSVQLWMASGKTSRRKTPAAALQDRRAPHPACSIFRPGARRKPLDADSLSAEHRAHRAARGASEVRERTAHVTYRDWREWVRGQRVIPLRSAKGKRTS